MNSYLFVLGTAHDLCKAELSHILGQTYNSFTLVDTGFPVIRVDTTDEFDVEKLNSKLGGTIKIAQVLGEVRSLSAEQLLLLLTTSTDHFIFGFSLYGSMPNSLTQLCKEIKDSLTQKGIKCRFVLPHEGLTLSAVVLKKQQVEEYILLFDKTHNTWLVAHSLVFQDVDAWAGRDTGRPFIAAKAGMLPLKVARMMVNLAELRMKNEELKGEKKVLLDPFCGMGSILSEAMLLNWNAFGSDIDADVIKKAQKNLDWLRQNYMSGKLKNFELYACDATHLSLKISSQTIDAIVTEPFLGAPFEVIGNYLYKKGKRVNEDSILNTVKGLEKLYIGAMREWVGLLKPAGRVVIAIPEIESFGKKYFVKKPVDTCENLGYTLIGGPYQYSRPQAIVKRIIYLFVRKKNLKL